MASTSGNIVFRCEDFANKNDSAGNESDIWDDTALIKAYDKAIKSCKGTGGQSPEDEISDGKNNQIKRSRHSKKSKKKKNKWRIGDQCHAVFSEDGHLYDASIKSINYKTGMCWVTYSGYGNEEEQKLSDLMASAELSDVPHRRRRTHISENDYDSMDCKDYTQIPDRPLSGNSQHHQYRAGPYPGWYPPSPHFSPYPPPPPVWAVAHQTPQLQPSAFPAGFPFVNMPHPASVSVSLPAVPPAPDIDDSDETGIHSMLMAWYMSGYHTGYYQGLRQGKRLSSSHTQAKPNDHQPVTGDDEVNENHLPVASDSKIDTDDTR